MGQQDLGAEAQTGCGEGLPQKGRPTQSVRTRQSEEHILQGQLWKPRQT